MLERHRRRLAPALVLLAAAGCTGPQVEPAFDEAVFSVVRDMAADLVSAEVVSETRRIDFGRPEDRGHLLDGWGDDEVDSGDGTTFVWGTGGSSLLDFTLLEPRELQVRARARAFRWPDAPVQEVTVTVNGHQVRSLDVGGGMQELRFTLPAATLRPGRNELRFDYLYSRPPREVIAGSPDPRPLAVAWDELWLWPRSAGLETRPALREGGVFLPLGTEVLLFLRPETDVYLVLREFELEGRSRRLRTETRFGAGGESVMTVVESPPGDVSAIPLPRGLVEVRLAALVDGSPRREPGGVLIKDATLRSRPPRPTAAPPEAAPPEAAPPAAKAGGGPVRPNVVVYLVDTLRADHLGCYGYPKPVSPHVDAFAAEGVLFEHTLAQSSWTRSSVASMMTGTVPTVHGVHDRADALAEGAVTLAEVLSAAGYATAAFVTNRSVGPSFGFQQGFDDFEFFARQETQALYPKSDAVNREVFAWLDERPRRPFLLYVHTMDPHAPYAPPPPTRRRLADGVRQPRLSPAQEAAFAELLAGPAGRFGSPTAQARLGSVPWLEALRSRRIDATPEIIEDMTALYDAEVAFNDASFGALLERLRRDGLYEDSLIVFVADHGEEFDDHGSWSHGATLFQEQLRVPLILKLPGAAGPARRVSDLAQHVDLLPTVLDALALEFPEGLGGRSLLASPGGEVAPRAGFSHLDLDGHQAASVVEGRYKLICGDPFVSACRLYDLESDPGETTDLSEELPVLRGYLASRMRAFFAGGRGLEAPEVEIDAELRARLEALGYL